MHEATAPQTHIIPCFIVTYASRRGLTTKEASIEQTNYVVTHSSHSAPLGKELIKGAEL